jgi:hypothetical protein
MPAVYAALAQDETRNDLIFDDVLLHRQHDGKSEVLVVDYVDEAVPMLVRMAAKRRTG